VFHLLVISWSVTPLMYFLILGCGAGPHTDTDWKIVVSSSLLSPSGRVMVMV
jgi:hypothetical protein